MKLLRILILFVLSFNLSAKTNESKSQIDVNPIEQAIVKLRSNDLELSKSIATLNNHVSSSIHSNSIVVKESRELIEQVEKLLQVQETQRKNILDVMEEAKEIKESKSDLSLSIESDDYAIWMNFGAAILIAFGSIYITYNVLTKTLANETEKQRIALGDNLSKTKDLNKIQIDAQLEIANQQNSALKDDLAGKISISNKQLETQLATVSEHTKEAHLLKIDEFRQLWIITFREDISALIKSLITLKNFYITEKGFMNALSKVSMLDLKIETISKKIMKEQTQSNLIEKINKLLSSPEYMEAFRVSNLAKEEFDLFKDQFKYYNLLRATIIEQKTKIILMFSPKGTENENFILNTIEKIDSLLTVDKQIIFEFEDDKEIDIKINELQLSVQKMLKIEWNRVRRINSKNIKQ